MVRVLWNSAVYGDWWYRVEAMVTLLSLRSANVAQPEGEQEGAGGARVRSVVRSMVSKIITWPMTGEKMIRTFAAPRQAGVQLSSPCLSLCELDR